MINCRGDGGTRTEDKGERERERQEGKKNEGGIFKKVLTRVEEGRFPHLWLFTDLEPKNEEREMKCRDG